MSAAQATAFVARHPGKSWPELQKVIKDETIPDSTFKALNNKAILQAAGEAGDRATAGQVASTQSQIAQAAQLILQTQLGIPQLKHLKEHGYDVEETDVDGNKTGKIVHYGLSSVGQKALQEALTATAASNQSVLEMGQVLKIGQNGEVDPARVTQQVVDYTKDKYGDNINFQAVLDGVQKLYGIKVAPYEASAKIAQAQNVTSGQVAKLVGEVGGLTAKNIEEKKKEILAALSKDGVRNIDFETVAKGLQSWFQLQQSIYALKSAGQEAGAKLLEAQIKSLNLTQIEQLSGLYKDFMELDEDGKPTKTFLEASKDPKFLQAWQQLPQPLQEVVKKGLGDQAEIFLKNLEVAGKKAQLDAQTLKYQTAVLGRLRKAGIRTAEDLARAGQDGSLQKIIDSQVGDDGQPISQEVRKAIMADFQSQFALQSSAAESVIKKADARNADQRADVEKMGLDMAEGILRGGTGGMRNMMMNSWNGVGLGAGLARNALKSEPTEIAPASNRRVVAARPVGPAGPVTSDG
jgi:hypothetical protein